MYICNKVQILLELAIPKKTILFICTGNSCRSQMAEAYVNSLCGERWIAYSAGTNPRVIDANAILAMQEEGIDISQQKSKPISALHGVQIDYVMTVCDRARELCPVYEGKEITLHFSFDDPAQMITKTMDASAINDVYGKTRDLIRDVVLDLLTDLEA